MPLHVNFTPFPADEFAGEDKDGREFFTLVLKATFSWSTTGQVVPAAEPVPLHPVDVHVGDPAQTGPVLPSDYVPFKPAVDLLLAGSIVRREPVKSADVTLAVGSRIRKTVRVTGERVWMPNGLGGLMLTSPVAFTSMPIEWDRAFGGMDPEAPDCAEPRNPFGRGLRKKAAGLERQRVPNFEHPGQPVSRWNDRPPPVGFGPVAASHPSRSRYAGTYDKDWEDNRFPLLPRDFDERFYNCAPEDQQLPTYPPGEAVLLEGMTDAGRDVFRLPELRVPITFVESQGARTEAVLTPDTVVLEPHLRRLTLSGRARHYPRGDILSLRTVFVGTPSRARLRAMDSGKAYVALGTRPGSGA